MNENIMDDRYQQSLLYDFYGELLTEHQKEIYSDYILNDYSLGEIASEHGITRQGVHDLIKRCNKTLASYEEKLKLVERFSNAKKKVSEIRQITDELKNLNENHKDEHVDREIQMIDQIAQDILKDF